MLKYLPELVFVSVLLTLSQSASDGQIKLSGSQSSRCSGRVEIFYRGSWGTVCDDSWDLNDAAVVCKQMGCGPALTAPGSASFGQGTGQIWLDNVACTGGERYLSYCPHLGLGKHDCRHGEDAGVTCLETLPKPSLTVNPVGMVTWGQDVSIVCSISTPHLGGTFTLQQTSGSFRKTQTSSSNSATFRILKVSFDNEGSYQCLYQIRISSRDFTSPLSDSVRLSVTVTLQKPSLTMNPVGMVTWGQDVSIICSVSTQHLRGTFTLQQTSGSFRKTKTSSSNSATFRILKVSFDNEGSYQCLYQIRISSRDFTSPLSDSVRLSVTVTLPKPSLTMNPVGMVTWGQDVSIICSVSTQHLGGTFTLQQTSGSFRKTQTSSSNSATFRILKVSFDNEGSYQCLYQIRISSRDFTSPLSDSVRLSVTVPLQQPNISLTSPNGGLVWGLKGAEVTKGYSFVITCLITTQYPGGVFSLISDSNNISTKPAVNFSASFSFPAAEFEHQANYSCVYKVTLSSRNFTSAEASLISITIKFPLLQMISSLIGGASLLLLLVLVVCLVPRKQVKQASAILQMDAMNHEPNEQEEHYYGNFEPVNCNRMQEQNRPMGKSDENCYQQEMKSDKEHRCEGASNYEDLDGCAPIIENRQKDVCQVISAVHVAPTEEETSENDDVYQNIHQHLAEDDLDIYGEDIYQNF